MNPRVFSAPGKLVIAGEYAVLEGHEALACSVDRSVHVTVTEHAALRKEEGPTACVREELKARGFALPPCAFHIDSHALYLRRGLKMGLGSSAAVTVALTRALMHQLGYDESDPLCFEVALCAHRRFTKSGSGIDVACAFYGGLIRYQNRQDEGVKVTVCKPTKAMQHLIAVHTGVAQSTNAFLEHIEESKRNAPLAFAESIAGIALAAQRIIQCMTCESELDDTLVQLCHAFREHNHYTQALALLADIDIISQAHRSIIALAESHGGTAKPSGAGGGDLALCVIPPAGRKAFTRALGAKNPFFFVATTGK